MLHNSECEYRFDTVWNVLSHPHHESLNQIPSCHARKTNKWRCRMCKSGQANVSTQIWSNQHVVTAAAPVKGCKCQMILSNKRRHALNPYSWQCPHLDSSRVHVVERVMTTTLKSCLFNCKADHISFLIAISALVCPKSNNLKMIRCFFVCLHVSGPSSVVRE